MDGDGRSTHLVEEEEEAEVADLKADQDVVGVVEEAAKDKAKEIEIKLKIELTEAIPPDDMREE